VKLAKGVNTSFASLTIIFLNFVHRLLGFFNGFLVRCKIFRVYCSI